MYVPRAFDCPVLDRLYELIRQYSFALLISQAATEPVATHLPLLLDPLDGAHGTLIGHLARANPQWVTFGQQSVLAIFSGPHRYISPSWYQAENVVPTWNYVAVHAYGRVEIISDREQLRLLTRRTVTVYESAMPTPWSMPEPNTQFEDRMLDQIVGFRIPIETIQGKWKLSQNHPPERREKIIVQLKQQGDSDSLAIARLMEAGLTEGSINPQ